MNLSVVNKRMNLLIRHDLRLWRRLFIEASFTRTGAIESDSACLQLNEPAPKIVTRELFMSYSATRNFLSQGAFHEELELPSDAMISPFSNDNDHNTPVLTTDETGFTLLLWNEKTDALKQFHWPMDNSLPAGPPNGPQLDNGKLILSNDMVVIYGNWIEGLATSWFMAVAQIRENELVPLWHQRHTNNGHWWICLVGNKMFRFRSSPLQQEATVECIKPTTGEVTNCVRVPFEFQDNFGELSAHDNNWIAIPCKSKILLVDVHTENVKYLKNSQDNVLLDFTGKLEIKDGLVFAMTLDNQLVAFNACSSEVVFKSTTNIPEPILGLCASERKLLMWSKNELLVYQNSSIRAKKGIMDSEINIEFSSSNHQEVFANPEDDEEVYHDIVGIQLVQDVTVICYTVNDVNMDTCDIKLAFLPRNSRDMGSANHVTVSVENTCIRPEMIQMLAAPTSAFINNPHDREMHILKFMQKI